MKSADSCVAYTERWPSRTTSNQQLATRNLYAIRCSICLSDPVAASVGGGDFGVLWGEVAEGAVALADLAGRGGECGDGDFVVFSDARDGAGCGWGDCDSAASLLVDYGGEFPGGCGVFL